MGRPGQVRHQWSTAPMQKGFSPAVCHIHVWSYFVLGKTHTMMGEHGVDFLQKDKAKQKRCFGIIPRAIQDLFVFAKMLQVDL